MSSTRYAIVLGGTVGLGREIAIKCLHRGLIPIVIGRTASTCDDERLEGAAFVEYDLLSPRMHQSQLDEVIARWGDCISHVFWVAGVPQARPFLDLEKGDLQSIMQTHVMGPMHFLQDLLNHFVENHHPIHLVTVSSVSAFTNKTGGEIYNATKSFQSMFTSQIAGRLKVELPGSEVTLMMPGGMDTRFWDVLDRGSRDLMDPVWVAERICNETIGDIAQREFASAEGNFRSIVFLPEPGGHGRVFERTPSVQFPF